MHLAPDKSDFFLTIDSPKEFDLKVKGSRFISHVFSVSTKEEAESILNKVRKLNYNATHNCFAYTLGLDGNNFRYSDDGEPSGTAGKPIFQAINSFDFKNILIIVTRYFGGTKLGVGPLSRAYYESSIEVLKICEKKIVYLTNTFEIESDYHLISILKQIFEEYAIEVKEEYLQNVKFTIEVLKSHSDKFKEIIIERTNGKIVINSI